MSGDTIITMAGHLTADPDLSFTPSGKAVANFTIASNPRHFKGGEWVDGEPLFMRCQLWGEPAENAADSLTKGQRVIAQGRLQQRQYETGEGEKRTVIEMVVTEVGVSLTFGKATFEKVNRKSGSKSDDPWSSTASKGKTSRRKSAPADDDEPPF